MKRMIALCVVLLFTIGLTLPAVAAGSMAFAVSYDGKVWEDGSIFTTIPEQNEILVEVKNVTDSLETLKIYYAWDDDKFALCAEGQKNATISIPDFSPGTMHELKLQAVSKSKKINSSIFLVIKPVTPVKAYAFLVPYDNMTITVPPGYAFTFATSTNLPAGIYGIYWAWDDEEFQPSYNSIIYIETPKEFKPGSTHRLYVAARALDDTMSPTYMYIINISE